MATATAPADTPAVFKSLFIWTAEDFNSIQPRPEGRFDPRMSLPRTCFTGFSPFLGIVLALQIKYEVKQQEHVDATCAGLGMPALWQLYHLLGKYLDDPDDEASLDEALKLATHVQEYFLVEEERPSWMSSTPMINTPYDQRRKMKQLLGMEDHKQDDEKAVEARGVMQRNEVVELRKVVKAVFERAYSLQFEIQSRERMADLEPAGREIDALISSNKLDVIRNGEARQQAQTLPPDHYREEFPKCETVSLWKGGNAVLADLTMTGQLHNTLRAIARLLEVDERKKSCFAKPVYVEVKEDEPEDARGITVETVTIHYRNRLRRVTRDLLARWGEKSKLNKALLQALHALDAANVVHGRLSLNSFRKDIDEDKYVIVDFRGSFALPLPGSVTWPTNRDPRDVPMFASGFCTEHAKTRRSFPMTLRDAQRVGREMIPPELCQLRHEDLGYQIVKSGEAPSFFAIGKPTDMFDAGLIRARLGGVERPELEELRTLEGVAAWVGRQQSLRNQQLLANLVGGPKQRKKEQEKGKGSANLNNIRGMLRMDPNFRLYVKDLLDLPGIGVKKTQLWTAAARDRDDGVRAFGGMYEGESEEEEEEMWPLPVSDKMADHPMYLEHLDLVDDNKRLKRKLRRVRRDIRDLCRALDLPIPSRGHSSRRRR